MSYFIHPKYSFTEKTFLFYGSEQSFSNDVSLPKRIAQFQLFLIGFLSERGITETMQEQGTYSTGGHSDQGYFALLFSSETGGCECIMHLIDWGGKHQACRPRIDLYGTWVKFEEALTAELQKYTKD